MKASIKSILRIVILSSIGILLLYLAFKKQNLAAMVEDIKAAKFEWIIVSVLCGLAAFISRAIRWRILIVAAGYSPSLIKSYHSMMIGYMANFAIPRIGEVTRCSALSQSEKIPFNICFGTVITERVIDLFMLIISLILAAFLELDTLGSFIYENIFLPLQNMGKKYFIIIISAMLILISALILFIKYRSKTGEGFFGKTYKQLFGVLEGVKSILKVKNFHWFILHTLIIWIMYFFMSYTAFFALDATNHLDAKAGTFVLAIGGIGMAAPVQGGFGVYHLLVQQGLMLFGLSSTDGLTYAVVVHTSQSLLVLILGSVSLLFLFLPVKRIMNEQS